MNRKSIKVALIGNPNTGKSSLFNQLTGLNQKIGNYPGITVDKKIGHFTLEDQTNVELIDLPGTYSLYPRSKDEELVIEVLSNPLHISYPDLVLVIVDASNLKRNLLLFSQIKDLGIPSMLIVNMIDELEKSNLEIDLQKLENHFHVPVIATNARKGFGLNTLKSRLKESLLGKEQITEWNLGFQGFKVFLEDLRTALGIKNPYLAWHWYAQPNLRDQLSIDKHQRLNNIQSNNSVKSSTVIAKEISHRFKTIDKIVDECILPDTITKSRKKSELLDKWLLHPVGGYLFFLLLLTLVFQAIFSFASIPMDLLDGLFATISQLIQSNLPQSFLTDLLANGLLPGIAGILIFIPQIAILFLFISLFEESGYMARIVFLMDKIMRPFGLNGKSMVPLISGYACAIPAVMSARSIGNWKERLSTILVIPFMTCSARLPVYTIIIALIVPSAAIFGFINAQALLLMALYILAAVTALLASLVLKFTLKTTEASTLIMELPDYKIPRFKNVAITIWQKTKSFVYGAGKIILAVSLILWLLSSFGPSEDFYHAEKIVAQKNITNPLPEEEFEKQVASFKLENSFIGKIGKLIEPTIKPLGYDWKIGIALLTSFAAREVFVGTMATIYSLDETDENVQTIKEKMASDINLETGLPRFSVATCFSLLIFYAFAMQCMSTMAVVYRETKSWKWPMLQLVVMTGLAYIGAWAVYVVLS